MIKADPNVVRYRRLRILYFGALMIMVVSFAPLYLTSTHSTPFRDWSFILPFFVLVSFFSFIQQGQYWKRFEQRRIRAAPGDQILLAAGQPAPDSPSLQLPTIIKLRLSKRFVLIGVIEVLVVVLVGGYLVYPLMRNHFSSGLFIVIGLFLALFLIMMGVAFAMISRQLSQQLDITEDGLTSRYMGTVGSIRWGEATLFATYAAFGAQKSKAVSTYELSGANSVVKWTWYKYKGKNSFMGIRPTIPIDECNQQMQALLSLVAAKTGLPLYDLREDLPKGEPKD